MIEYHWVSRNLSVIVCNIPHFPFILMCSKLHTSHCFWPQWVLTFNTRVMYIVSPGKAQGKVPMHITEDTVSNCHLHSLVEYLFVPELLFYTGTALLNVSCYVFTAPQLLFTCLTHQYNFSSIQRSSRQWLFQHKWTRHDQTGTLETSMITSPEMLLVEI